MHFHWRPQNKRSVDILTVQVTALLYSPCSCEAYRHHDRGTRERLIGGERGVLWREEVVRGMLFEEVVRGMDVI